MIPQPLHPAVVHFPIVFVMLLPVVAVIAMLMIRRGSTVRAAWLPVVALAAGLTLSSWVALQTGEREEEVVERVVGESAIHDHEEAAEIFVWLTGAGLLLALAGLTARRGGTALRTATVLAALGLTVAGYRVGHSGGALVYEHGAAVAYSDGSAASGGEGEELHSERRDRDEGDHDDGR